MYIAWSRVFVARTIVCSRLLNSHTISLPERRESMRNREICVAFCLLSLEVRLVRERGDSRESFACQRSLVSVGLT